MNNQPLRVAIVGCGRIADGHVQQIQRLPALAQLVAVCDREPFMAEQLATRFGIRRTYTDYEALLRAERPDVVHVTTPPSSHVPLAVAAMEAGCHVYAEKPLAPRHEQAVALVRASERAGVMLTVGYTYLFDPPAVAMRELIADGQLGEPVHIESHYGYDLRGPFGRALMADPNHWVHHLPGKLLQNTIDHMLNKLPELIEDDDPKVLAIGQRLEQTSLMDERDELIDELRLMVAGERVTAQASFSSHARPVGHHYRVYGTRNTIEVDFLAGTVTMLTAPRMPSAIGRLGPAFERALDYAVGGARNVLRFARSDFHYFAGLRNLLELFYRAIQTGGPPPIPTRDMLWVSQVMGRVFRQLSTTPSLVPLIQEGVA